MKFVNDDHEIYHQLYERTKFENFMQILFLHCNQMVLERYNGKD